MKKVLGRVFYFALLGSTLLPHAMADGWVKKAKDQVYLMDLDYPLMKNLSIGISVGDLNDETGISVTYFKKGPMGGRYVTELGSQFEACYLVVREGRDRKLKNFTIRAAVPDFVAHDLGQKKTELTIALSSSIIANPDYPEDDFKRMITHIDILGNYGNSHLQIKDEQNVSPKIFELTGKLRNAKRCR